MEAPLKGIRVAVTRAKAQAQELADPLRQLGADVLVAPLIRIAASIDRPAVLSALNNLNQYQWLVLTSVNGVEHFVEALRGTGKSIEAVSSVRVACVGPATAKAARDRGLEVDVVPDAFAGDALGARLVNEVGAGARVLLARAAAAREELPKQLTEHGAKVDEIELYRSLPDADGARLLRGRLLAGQIDVLTFTSGSTVRYFAEAIGQLARARVAVIGPATAEAARRYSVRVDLEASRHTTQGLVDAMVEYFRREKRPTED